MATSSLGNFASYLGFGACTRGRIVGTARYLYHPRQSSIPTQIDSWHVFSPDQWAQLVNRTASVHPNLQFTPVTRNSDNEIAYRNNEHGAYYGNNFQLINTRCHNEAQQTRMVIPGAHSRTNLVEINYTSENSAGTLGDSPTKEPMA